MLHITLPTNNWIDIGMVSIIITTYKPNWNVLIQSNKVTVIYQPFIKRLYG